MLEILTLIAALSSTPALPEGLCRMPEASWSVALNEVHAKGVNATMREVAGSDNIANVFTDLEARFGAAPSSLKEKTKKILLIHNPDKLFTLGIFLDANGCTLDVVDIPDEGAGI